MVNTGAESKGIITLASLLEEVDRRLKDPNLDPDQRYAIASRVLFLEE